MDESGAPTLRVAAVVGDGVRDLAKPPFAILIGLQILISLVTASLPEGPDDFGAIAFLGLSAASGYLQIALVLAAAEPAPGRAADPFIRAAFGRRCFWRFAGASVLEAIAVGIGLLGLVVGAVVVGGIVALAQPAAVLERARPIEALRRSRALTRPARSQIAAIYGTFFLVPLLTVQGGYLLGLPARLGWAWIAISLPAVPLTSLAQICLTRAFLALGGRFVRAPQPEAR